MNKLILFVVFLVYIKRSQEFLKTVPTSQNVTVGSNVEFFCGTNDSSLNILWFYDVPVTVSSHPLPGGGYLRSLELTAHAEYNESIFFCYLLNGTFQLEYSKALLLIQGTLASISNLSVIRHEPCSAILSWDPPYSLEGVPILGYNVTVSSAESDWNIIINMTSYELFPSILNAIYDFMVSGINDAGEGNTSNIFITFSNEIEDSVIENYYWNENEWQMMFVLKGICMNSLVEQTTFDICQMMSNCLSLTINTNNTYLINYTTTVNPSNNNENIVMMSVKLILPENKFLSLNFTLHYDNKEKMVSQSHEINTHDVLSATITDIEDGLMCLSIGCRESSKAIGAVLILRSESGMIVCNYSIMKPVNQDNCSLETCLTNLPANNYTLYIYDLETTPFVLNDEVPAVIIPSISITRAIITSSNVHSVSSYSVTVQSSISDIVISSWSTDTPTIAPTVTVAVISSTYTATKMTNLETNKTLIITTSAAGGGVCLILLLTIVLLCSYFFLRKRKQMSIAQIEVEPQYCEVLPLEEKVKVSECQAYGKLDKERVKVSECQAYGKLDKERVKVSECQAYGKLDKERVKVSECQAYGKLDQLRIARNTS